MIDNHTHLDLISDSIENIINRAKAKGVTQFIVPGIIGFPQKLEELQKYKEVKICWGIYPKYAEIENIFEKEFEKLKNSSIKVVAIGECGLDKRFPNIIKQIELFKKQINISLDYNLPLIIHLVGHWQKAYQILKDSNALPSFILHSWNGSVEMAKEFVKIGGTLSLSASALKNPNKLSELLKTIPIDRIIFETDSPDQKPYFINGLENEPANLPLIIDKIKSYI
ncbi:MAG: TatD family hydrolase [Candidatus Riflebacteria bacterium]|nr:TatD family hydrolase [Candidatus Riflebacteria bacterium]